MASDFFCEGLLDDVGPELGIHVQLLEATVLFFELHYSCFVTICDCRRGLLFRREVALQLDHTLPGRLEFGIEFVSPPITRFQIVLLFVMQLQ